MRIQTNVQYDVEEELHWDPSIPSEHIGVTVLDDVVQLSGRVGSFYEKWAAERAALRVNSVKAVANEIRVDLLPDDSPSDTELAQAALHHLEWNCKIPDTIKVKVSNGWVMFEGTVEAPYQKDEAERVLRSLKGLKGFANEIEVKPSVDVAVLEQNISSALERSALVDAKKINIEVDRGVVTLTGQVRPWAERDEARKTAWAAPGVTTVKDLINVKWD